MHRDVRPVNILLFNSYRDAKLTDFGLSKEITGDDQMHTNNIGRSCHCAPEGTGKHDVSLFISF